MRSRPDRALPEAYRAWIDPTQPLPGDVHLLPREVKVGEDLLIALGLGGTFAALGTLMGTFLTGLFHATEGGALELWPLLLFTAVTAGLWLVPLILVRRLIGTLRASKDAKDGRLRQGLLLGRQGLLLRLTPNQSYVVPAKEFVAARLRFSRRGPTQQQGLFRIETRGDAVEFFAHRLQGQPDDVNRHAQRFWGVGGKRLRKGR